MGVERCVVGGVGRERGGCQIFFLAGVQTRCMHAGPASASGMVPELPAQVHLSQMLQVSPDTAG